MRALLALTLMPGAALADAAALAQCVAEAERAAVCVAEGDVASWDALERRAYADRLATLAAHDATPGMGAGPLVAGLARDEADWRAALPVDPAARRAALAARIDALWLHTHPVRTE